MFSAPGHASASIEHSRRHVAKDEVAVAIGEVQMPNEIFRVEPSARLCMSGPDEIARGLDTERRR